MACVRPSLRLMFDSVLACVWIHMCHCGVLSASFEYIDGDDILSTAGWLRALRLVSSLFKQA